MINHDHDDVMFFIKKIFYKSRFSNSALPHAKSRHFLFRHPQSLGKSKGTHKSWSTWQSSQGTRRHIAHHTRVNSAGRRNPKFHNEDEHHIC